MNQTMIYGRVGGDPEGRQVGGSTVANFSVAVSERWRDKNGEQQERTTWFRCAAWGALAERVILPHVKKGDSVIVCGTVSARAYEANGEARASLELKVRDFSFAGGKRDESAQSAPRAPQTSAREYAQATGTTAPPAPATAAHAAQMLDDDIPF